MKRVQPLNLCELICTRNQPDVSHQHITAYLLNRKTAGERNPAMKPKKPVENNNTTMIHQPLGTCMYTQST